MTHPAPSQPAGNHRPRLLVLLALVATSAITLTACSTSAPRTGAASHVTGRCLPGYIDTASPGGQFTPGLPASTDTADPAAVLQVTLTNRGPTSATVAAVSIEFRHSKTDTQRGVLDFIPVTIAADRSAIFNAAGASHSPQSLSQINLQAVADTTCTVTAVHVVTSERNSQ